MPEVTDPQLRLYVEKDGVLTPLDFSSDLINTIYPAIKVQPLSADGKAHAGTAHDRAHQGVLFRIDSSDATYDAQILNGTSLDMVITATGDNYPHLDIAYRLGGAGRILVYKLDVAPTGGTAITPKNNKWDSATTFGGTVLRNPTVDLTGAELKSACMILGTAQGNTRTGSAGAFYDEEIVDGICLVRLVNNSGGTVTACLCINAYNAGKIPT